MKIYVVPYVFVEILYPREERDEKDIVVNADYGNGMWTCFECRWLC